MAKTKCQSNTDTTRDAMDLFNAALQADVEAAVTDLIGDEARITKRWSQGTPLERKAFESWKSLKNSLVKHLMENATIAGIDNYDPKTYVTLLQDYIQKMMKIQLHPYTIFEHANPTRMIAVSKLIRQLMALQTSRYGKKLNAFERAILPTALFTMRVDPFGHVYKYAIKAINWREDSRQSAAKWKDRYNKIVASYVRGIDNALANIPEVTPEYIFGNKNIRTIDDIDEEDPNILEEGIKDMITKDKRNVTYFGTIEKEDTTKVHLVIDNTTMEKMELPYSLLSKSTINEAVRGKYANELVNDIQHGQTRYIQWHSKIKPEHEKKVAEVFRKIKYKDQLDKEDARKGMPEIHYTTFGDMNINYIVLKDGVTESKTSTGETVITDIGQETYSAYIVSYQVKGKDKVFFGTKSNLPLDRIRSMTRNLVFRDGYYRSDEYKTYGKGYIETTDKKGKVTGRELTEQRMERGWNFNQLRTRWLERQPHPNLVGQQPRAKDIRLQKTALWPMLMAMRQMYNQIGDDLKERTIQELDEIREWLAEGGKLNQTIKKHMPKAQVKKVMRVLRETFDINSRIWVDKAGNIHTPNSHFMKMSHNYAPVIYEESVVDEMLEEAMQQIENRMLEMPAGEQKEELKKQLLEFRLTYARRQDPYMSDEVAALEQELSQAGSATPASGVIAERAVHLKHRAQWTDLTKRKKTGNVHAQYLDSVYGSLQRNKLMNNMMETLNLVLNANKGEFAQETYNWLINRTKIAFNNPLQEGGYKGERVKLDWSAQRMANIMNKFGKKRKWTAEDAQRMLTWSKGFFGATLLGSNVGLTNRTQIVNNVINWGYKAAMKAAKIVDGKDPLFTEEVVNALIDHAGTDEVTNMLMDALAQGTDIDMSDAGMIDLPGLPFQLPMRAMKDFLWMLKNNRKSFVEKGIPEIDRQLRKQDVSIRNNQIKRIEWKKEQIKEALSKNRISVAKFNAVIKPLEREEARLKDPEQKRTVRVLRELYMDLITTPKSENNRKALEAKFKRYMGDVTDNRMKRMVAWKLSWWWDGLAPELFTMTEGERLMRKQTVVTAILTNIDMGTLGNVDWKNKETMEKYTYVDKKSGNTVSVDIPEALLSDSAVRIARNAVNNTMFGMSTVHLGEAFIGAGMHMGLYKAYPLQQMEHDYNVLKSWWAGSENAQENMVRLGKEMAAAAKRAYLRIEYDPNDTTIDHEALKVLRLISSRLAMSAVSVALETLSIFRWLFRTPMAKQFSYMIRGGENPVFAIAFRMLVNGLIWAAYDDDDQFEGDLVEVGWDVARLFFPVFLTLPLNEIARWVE